jgi:hypothetical protein
VLPKEALHLANFGLVVTDYVPYTLQTQLQLLLEFELEFNVLLGEQLYIPAVLLELLLHSCKALLHLQVLSFF